jgi:hypothetical protein
MRAANSKDSSPLAPWMAGYWGPSLSFRRARFGMTDGALHLRPLTSKVHRRVRLVGSQREFWVVWRKTVPKRAARNGEGVRRTLCREAKAWNLWGCERSTAAPGRIAARGIWTIFFFPPAATPLRERREADRSMMLSKGAIHSPGDVSQIGWSRAGIVTPMACRETA